MKLLKNFRHEIDKDLCGRDHVKGVLLIHEQGFTITSQVNNLVELGVCGWGGGYVKGVLLIHEQ